MFAHCDKTKNPACKVKRDRESNRLLMTYLSPNVECELAPSLRGCQGFNGRYPSAFLDKQCERTGQR